MLNLLAGADARTGRATAHIAVGLEPADRAVEALPVVLIGRSELGGQVGELELLLIDLLTAADQLGSDRLAGSRRSLPGLNLHDQSVRTSVWSVNKIGLLIFECTKRGSLLLPAPPAGVGYPADRYPEPLLTVDACPCGSQWSSSAWRSGRLRSIQAADRALQEIAQSGVGSVVSGVTPVSMASLALSRIA